MAARLALAVCAGLHLAGSALADARVAGGAAEVTAGPAQSVFVTIYRDDLALITETRTVDLPPGRVRIAFEGVLDSVIPPSAVIRGFEGLEAERNFDFDGLSPRSLLWKSIGEPVSVVRTKPGTGAEVREDATILAAGEGIALAFKDRFEALGCSGLPERVVFAKAPAGLRAKPTLSTTLSQAPPGRRTLTLSYLATGLTWSANYVATLDPSRQTADLLGWVTLNNNAASGFADAGVGVVAGDLSRVFTPQTRAAVAQFVRRACYPMQTTSDFPPIDRFWERDARMRMMKVGAPPPPPPPPPPPAMAMAEAAMATGAMMQQETLSDYQLYTMPVPTGVAASQMKQVAFLAKSDVRYQTTYRYRLDDPRYEDGGVHATQILLKFKNEEADGLGVPLPRGTVRVMGDPGAGPLLLGADDIRDTAVGLDWKLEMAASSAVTAAPRIAKLTQRKLRDGRLRLTAFVEVRLANANARPVEVEVVQPVLGPSQTITGASRPFVMKDGEQTAFVAVPARSSEVLSYRIRWIE